MTRHHLKLTLLILLSAGPLLAAEPAAPAPRMPETTTTAFTSVLSEETPVGVTKRPEWTSARRFPGTRVFIQKEPWEVGIESWWRLKHRRDNGLPGRFQLDLYNDIEGDETGAFHYQSFNVELRWALADWGVLWGNPTLYAEYKFADAHWGPDVYEFKLLLGDQLAPRWHWGVNFVWEAETGGLSYTALDGKLGVGVEVFYDHDSVAGARGNADDLFAVGPSIQRRVTNHLHIDPSCMFGTNQATERQIGFLVVGYDFGPGGHAERTYTPISGQRN